MNLGDANLRTVSSTYIHQRRVGFPNRMTRLTLLPISASRPALVHSASKQSVTASDDFYSLPSSNSSQDEKSAIPRCQTPPLHILPDPYRKSPEPVSTRPTVRAVTPTQLKLPSAPLTAKLAASHPIHTIQRKPLSTGITPPSDSPSNKEPIGPPTPGIDDTPYIHFAIDQLTRDEEVNHALGSRPLQRPSTRESYSVERIVPDERLQQRLQSEDRRQRPLHPTRQPSDSSG